MLKTLVIGLALAYALALVGTALFHRRFLYHPELPGDPVPRPAEVGLVGAEEVAFVAADGVPLHGWFQPPIGPPNGFSLLLFHGNAGHVGHRAESLRTFAAEGFAAFCFDYRGFGKSGGSPTEDGLYRDARAALAALRARPGVDPGKIIYLGSSLGSGPAIQLSTEEPPAALVLDAPFVSARAMARAWFPLVAPLLDFAILDRYENESKIARVRAPVVVIHGDRDEVIPVEQGRRVFAAAREPKTLRIVNGADHNGCLAVDRRGYLAALRGAVQLGAPAAAPAGRASPP